MLCLCSLCISLLGASSSEARRVDTCWRASNRGGSRPARRESAFHSKEGRTVEGSIRGKEVEGAAIAGLEEAAAAAAAAEEEDDADRDEELDADRAGAAAYDDDEDEAAAAACGPTCDAAAAASWLEAAAPPICMSRRLWTLCGGGTARPSSLPSASSPRRE